MERALHREGVALVCGVDEAGRGPLAGPVCAAAVILPEGVELPGIAFASVEEIERMNILAAALLAMDRAIAQLSPAPELALIDGNTVKGISVPARSVVGGDGKVAAIAAASVLAKVTRDRLMLTLAEKYPQYGFENHKGYGTKEHYAALEKYGPSPVHRMSFLKKFYAKR